VPDEVTDDLDAERRAAGIPVARTSHDVVGADAREIGTLPEGGEPPFGGGAPLKSGTGKVRFGDRAFFGISLGAGVFIIALVVGVAIFLFWEAVPSLKNNQANFLTSRAWSLTNEGEAFGIAALLWTTILISVFALILAVPLSIGIALFITNYAPPRLARPVAYAVDLLAAIPSIIYGIWGITVLAPRLTPVQHALSSALGWIPLFSDEGIPIGTVFDGGVVLAVMILPIITSISREVFQRTPRPNVEAALALGATRWEMIRISVLPFGRPGVVSGSMLGLGRALGETLAVTIIVHAAAPGAPWSPSLFSQGQTIAARIATGGDSLYSHPGPFIAAGLVLFLLTFVVNAAARVIVRRQATS
jgi:phosphate transport system permease protein